MNWIEYCEKLGIGFSDETKFEYIKTNVISFIGSLDSDSIHSIFSKFCLMTGTPYQSHYSRYESHAKVISTFNSKCKNLKTLLAYFIALTNSAPTDSIQFRKFLTQFIEKQLTDANIKYRITNEVNDIFLFPEGANELDDALIAEPCEWLNDYPQSQESFIRSLKQYSNQEYTRDIADNLRKSLEEFLHEFFGNKKNLANNIAEVSKYLKDIGGSEELVNIFKGILNAYDSFNNKCVKHHDLIDPMFLEFLLYQTGLFIRMLIVARKSSGK